jgi:hypothetical protein
MQTVKEYTIISAKSNVELIKAVNEKIKENWYPVGGVSTVETGPQTTGTPGILMKSTISFQAMVK